MLFLPAFEIAGTAKAQTVDAQDPQNILDGTDRVAEACGTPVFGINNVSIDQSASSATIAQRLGTRAAAETAFRVVLDRLLGANDVVTEFLTTHDLDKFTDFVQIAEENTLEGRYIARLNFCFDSARLRAAFGAANLQWAELQSPSILVIPVWQGPDGVRAWKRDNQWLSGWRDAVGATTGLVSLKLLAPTIMNERNLRAEDLVVADKTTLRKAAKLANAAQIMLVIARLDYTGEQRVISVDGQLLSDQGEGLAQLGRMVDIPATANLSSQLDVARQKIIGELETSWHTANLISGVEQRELALQVPVESLAEWSSRLADLDRVAVIADYQIRVLSVDGGLLTISLTGSLSALQNALTDRKLRIEMSEDGTGTLLPIETN